MERRLRSLNATAQAAYQLQEPERCPVDRFSERTQSIWLTSSRLPCTPSPEAFPILLDEDRHQSCSSAAAAWRRRRHIQCPHSASPLRSLSFHGDQRGETAPLDLLVSSSSTQERRLATWFPPDPIMPHSFQQKKGETPSFFSSACHYQLVSAAVPEEGMWTTRWNIHKETCSKYHV